jgi:integrative and conjugative element protein (TIGR02256 family)
MVADADQWHDLETGGTFAGYWADEDEVVVTAHVRAGPSASRERHSYEPDLALQQQLDAVYETSGRLDAYIGDWHSHPGAEKAHLSSKDIACLKTIISSSLARQPKPLMILMIGKPGYRTLSASISRVRRVLGVFSIVVTDDADIRLS